MSVTFQLGRGTEINLIMTEGAAPNYDWVVEGGVVNIDKRGDGGGDNIR